MEVHFRRELGTPPAPSSGGGSGKPREEKRTALSKVVVRRLPPGLTKRQLEEQLRPLPAHDYFELFPADLSLHPHLYSRAYINFRDPDDVLLFRDRFDGFIFTDNKGLEYPAVVEFAPFQKVAKKKLKKKDAKTGSIEDDPEYKKFLETYSVEEEKTSASPEILLGELEARARELTARRTTPLLEYIKSRKLEKQRIREVKREERRRRELEKKRLREEEKKKRREEERCKKKETDKQKKITEKDVRIKLLKKPEKGEEPPTEKPKERGEETGVGDGKPEVVKARPLESSLEELREKRISRKLDQKWNSQDLRWHPYGVLVPQADVPTAVSLQSILILNNFLPDINAYFHFQDQPAVQLHQPGTRLRVHECGRRPSKEGCGGRSGEAEDSAGAAPKKNEEAE